MNNNDPNALECAICEREYMREQSQPDRPNICNQCYAEETKMDNKENNLKKPISQFEFAIMELADPIKAKLYRPFTDKESDVMRAKSIKEQISNLKVLKP